jgi:serine/threonine-protein kinase
MAPEQSRGRATPASDVYSAGVVLYEMLAGRPPFGGDSAVELALQHLQDPPPPPAADLPASLKGVVFRSLAKDPDERYPDGDDLAAALVGAASDTSDAPETRTTRAGRPNGSRPGRTLVAPAWSARRSIDVSGRRRTVAAFGATLLVLAGLLLGAFLARATEVRVPDLRGVSQTVLKARLARADLALRTIHRYSSAPAGAVIAQHPAAGARADTGTRVRVTLSAGPPPVLVPGVVGFSVSDASKLIKQLGLSVRARPVPGFGAAVGSVTGQSPQPHVSLRHGGTVTVDVAEAPQWRTITGFSGSQSVPFRVQGRRWRVVYRMDYSDTCAFIVFCSGPTARIRSLSTGNQVGSFSLNTGTGQTQDFDTGPGTYQVSVTPGDDSARWSVNVQDWY